MLRLTPRKAWAELGSYSRRLDGPERESLWGAAWLPQKTWNLKRCPRKLLLQASWFPGLLGGCRCSARLVHAMVQAPGIFRRAESLL